MRNSSLNQLSRTTLIPDDLVAAILAGSEPPLEEIVAALLIGSLDCHATLVGDPASTLNEKRLARQNLIVAFLTALRF